MEGLAWTPRIVMRTRCKERQWFRRLTINAWSEIDTWPDEEQLPYGSLQKAVRRGFGFCCQELWIEDGKLQGCWNGFSRASKGDASVLEKKMANAGPPSGSDKESLWVEVEFTDSKPCYSGPSRI